MDEFDFQDTLVLRNQKTGKELKFPIELNFSEASSDILVGYNGEIYKLVNVKPKQQLKFESLLKEFGEKYYDEVGALFPDYGKDTDSDPLPVEAVKKEILKRCIGRFKPIRQAISSDKQLLQKTIETFVQYIAVTRTIVNKRNETKQLRLDSSFCLDYALRYVAMFNDVCAKVVNDKKEIFSLLSKGLKQLQENIQYDERNPIGLSFVMQATKPFVLFLQENNDKITAIHCKNTVYTEEELEDFYKELMESIKQVTDSLNVMITSWTTIRQNIPSIDKYQYHIEKAIHLHSEILREYQEFKVKPKTDESDINAQKRAFLEKFKKYIEAIEEYGLEMSLNRNTCSEENQKDLELQYDIVFYHMKNKDKNTMWIETILQEIEKILYFLQKKKSKTQV